MADGKRSRREGTTVTDADWTTPGKRGENGSVQCAATTRMGERCTQWSTPGKHVCRMHGGLSPSSTGECTTYAGTRTLAEEIRAAREGGYVDLLDELAVIRGIASRAVGVCSDISAALAEINPDGRVDLSKIELDTLQQTAAVVESVGGMVDRIDRMEQRRAITPEQVELLVRSIVELTCRYLGPERVVELENDLMVLPWPKGVRVELGRSRKSDDKLRELLLAAPARSLPCESS